MIRAGAALVATLALSLGTAYGKDNHAAFNYPEPKDLSKHRQVELWGTFYHTKLAQNAKDGFALLDAHNKPIGPKLAHEDWCKAALEGAVAIAMPDGKRIIVNVRDAEGPSQVNCDRYFPHLNERARWGMRHTRFFKVTSPTVKYGYGVDDMPLLAFRTVAVDRRQIPVPYRSLLYIPDLRGRALTLEDGTAFTHDGYVFAADTGSNVHGNHIDFYTGFVNSNPFPDLAGGEKHRFKAYLVREGPILEELLNLLTNKPKS